MILVYLAIALGVTIIINELAKMAVDWIDTRPLSPTDRYCAWADARLDQAATTPSEPIGPYGHCEDVFPAEWVRESESAS